MFWSITVLPVLGGAITNARWPFPIGDIKSITRHVGSSVWCPAFPFLSVVVRQDTKVSNCQNLSMPDNIRFLKIYLVYFKSAKYLSPSLVILFHPLLYHHFSAQTF